MARDHSRIDLKIWNDDDWLDLSNDAQYLYFVMLTSPGLTFAGVMDWRPARIRALARGWSQEIFNRASAELAKNLFIVVDEDTEEALIRSFVRHDGLMKQRNMAVAMVRGFEAIASRSIRGVFVHELTRLREDQPELKGWPACEEVLARRSIDPATYPTGHPSIDPSIDPSVKGESTPYIDPSLTPLLPNSLPPLLPNSPLPPPAKTIPAPHRFVEFWATYPRRTAKGDALKAYTKALTITDADTIIDAAQAYADDPNRDDAFTAHPSTWLNGQRWDDDPLPARAAAAGTAGPKLSSREQKYLDAEMLKENPDPRALEMMGQTPQQRMLG